MKGLFEHEQAIDDLDDAFSRRRIRTMRQILVWYEGNRGFIDLGAFTNRGLIACEIERSTARIDRDLAKAVHARAFQLWIVVLNHRMRTRVRKRLAALKTQENDFLAVLTLPQAIQEVARI
jgi:hypothetical protein